MDPNQAWADAVRLADAIVANPSPDVEAAQLAETVLGLDEWVRKGGFPPAVFEVDDQQQGREPSDG